MSFALLNTPALTAGLLADDFVHQLILSGSHELAAYHQNWTRLFQFSVPEINASLRADGMLAWWADMELRYSFFRPLSALTHRLDFILWPHSSALMHLHSIGWAVLCIVAVNVLYRELFERTWVANLGMLFYAFDPTRAVTVGWIANRNALVACALGLFSIVTYLRGVRGSRAARWASPVLFGAALASSEAGFAAAGYLLGAALFLDRGALALRLRKLVPHLVLAILIFTTSRMLGFGVARSGAYFDPLRDAAHYLSALPGRALALQASAFGGPSADLWNAYELILPGLSTTIVLLDLLAVVFWVRVLAPLVKRSPSGRFALTGAVLALLPAAAAPPSDRLLGWVAVGVMVLMSEFFASFSNGQEGSSRRVAAAALAIVTMRLIAGPAVLLAQSMNVNRVHQMLDRTNHAIPWTPAVTSDDIIVINPPQDPLMTFVPPLRAAEGLPRPASQRWLATGLTAVAVRRTGDRTLEITQEDGFLKYHTERLVRSPDHALHIGDKVELPEFTVEVLAVTPDERPLRVRVDFQHELSAPNMSWLAYRDGTYHVFTVPELGRCVELPADYFLALLLGPNNAFARFFASQYRALSPQHRDLCSSAVQE